MQYEISNNNPNDIVRFFDITEGKDKPGNGTLIQFLKILENNNIQYSAKLDEKNKIVMVIAFDYIKR